MSGTPDTDAFPGGTEAPLRVDELEQVVDACDRFEAAWKAGQRPAIEEYVAGVPQHARKRLERELLALEIELKQRSGEATADKPGAHDTARNLLFGMLAMHNGFIDRDALLAAFSIWIVDRTKEIGLILVEQRALTEDLRTVLEGLVGAHLRQHGSDPEQSLAALGSVSSTRAALKHIGEADVQSGLACLDQARTRAAGDAGSTTIDLGGAETAGGRFRILRSHAHGGLGEVFIARDLEVRREVALKQILADAADHPERRKRFVVEAEITGGLEHPGIVPIYSLGAQADGRPFYAMRFIRGDTLKDAIERFHRDDSPGKAAGTRSLELRTLLGRFLDVCDTIAYAHSRGVLHRDLKPANIMLGPYGETLVLDWGLAKAVGRRLDPSDPAPAENTLVPESGSDIQQTGAGAQVGIPAYMAPEQAAGRNDEVGPASDVYSLGATLYALLTGQPPIVDQDRSALFRKLQAGEFPRPRAIRSWIDPALEAVCLKAMARQPNQRYASPRALAQDLQKWLADEPVAAWTEPWSRRARRWVGRRRTLVTSAAAVILVTALGLVAYATQRLTAARARVQALASADIRLVPQLIAELGNDRGLVRQRLRHLADARPGTPGRIAAAIALLPDESNRADELAARLLQNDDDVTPEEVLVIREALADESLLAAVSARFASAVDDLHSPLTDSQLRVLGALALAEPDSDRWTRPMPAGPHVQNDPPERGSSGQPAAEGAGPRVDPSGSQRGPATVADLVAEKLTKADPLRLDGWRRVFQPVAQSLVVPLRKIHAGQDAGTRDRVYTLLLAFANQPGNPTRAEDLAAIVAEAEPERMSQILALLTRPADRARATAALESLLQPLARFDTALAERQGRIAAALMRLEAPAHVWPLFELRDDPSVRTELIHEFVRYGLDPGLVIARLRIEKDVSALRALVLCLGEYRVEALPQEEHRRLKSVFLTWYGKHSDPGLHGAVDWLLRQRWGLATELVEIDKELASRSVPKDRDWYVNVQGQTFAIVRKPVTFMMGWSAEGLETVAQMTPEGRRRLFDNSRMHRRHIPRSFAISTREITVSEYSRFLDTRPMGVEDHREHQHFRTYFPSPDCAVGDVDWYAAASYCNWLSAKEGIPKEDWCYPDKIGPGMLLPKDHLDLAGYRLSTEAEWEYACRSGTVTPRGWGTGDRRLPKYAWYLGAEGASRPPGMLKPNDLGLFDTLGNLGEWRCDPARDPIVGYPVPKGEEPVVDVLEEAPFSGDVVRRMRGMSTGWPLGSFSATRGSHWPGAPASHLGLRPVRTLPQDKTGDRNLSER
jgi:serine/threonine protein kinase/formylglycine-generating enzyme required for sulfatase activity